MPAQHWLDRLKRRISGRTTFRSSDYWENRYASGGNSGDGSYGDLAIFKAEVLNDFIERNKIESAVEWGCGDGHQLSLLQVPKYLGLDVSPTTIGRCKDRFRGKSNLDFDVIHPGGQPEATKAQLSLSLDVIYHLVEDEVYNDYLRRVFQSSTEFVIVYSTNTDKQPTQQGAHVRHRHFTRDVEKHHPEFELFEHLTNRFPEQSKAEFFFYRKRH